MSRLVCQYCGNWMEDSDELCPICSAANPNHKRIASTTPTSIEELQQWYRDRNLPPAEVTKFYIGQNVQVPGAYGIYRDMSEVVLYKNRTDGTRAVRYKGKDEEYAINELYLKLKEEILNQKARQQYEREQSAERRTSAPQRTYQQSTVTVNSSQVNKSGKIVTKIIIIFLVLQFGLPLLAIVPMLIFGLISSFSDIGSDDYYENSYDLEDDCYYVERSDVFYYDGEDVGGHVVWSYDTTSEQWFKITYRDESSLPFDDESQCYTLVYSLCRDYPNFDEDTLDITRNKDFINDGHWKTPKCGYYLFNGFCYYMDSADSKWFIYDQYEEEYIFVAAANNKAEVPTDLYYYPDDYFISNDYSYFSERVQGYYVPAFTK